MTLLDVCACLHPVVFLSGFPWDSTAARLAEHPALRGTCTDCGANVTARLNEDTRWTIEQQS